MAQTLTNGSQINIADETNQGVSFRATNNEAAGGAEGTKFIVSSQLLFNKIVASDLVQSQSLAQDESTVFDVPSTTPYSNTKNFDLKGIQEGGSVRITGEVFVVDNNDIDFGYNINATSGANVVIINNVPSNTLTPFSIDIPVVNLNDNVRLGFQSTGPNGVVCRLSNVEVKFDYQSTNKGAIFN